MNPNLPEWIPLFAVIRPSIRCRHPQELRLEFQGQLADIVQKNRSAVGNLETPDLLRIDSSECPVLPFEKLA